MTEVVDWIVRPGIGVGAVELGMSSDAVRQAVGPSLRRSVRGEFELLYFEAITVGLMRGRVTMTVAEQASLARLEDHSTVRVGVPFTELQHALDEPLHYVEEEGLWSSAAHGGVLFEIARPADPGEEPVDPPLVPELYNITRPSVAVLRRMFVQ